MKAWRYKNARVPAVALALATAFAAPVSLAAKPGGETAGNNLSFPVIWAEGVEKALPGTPQTDPVLFGEWWYQWGTNGTDPNVTPASCPPDPDDDAYCDDGLPDSVGPAPGDPPADNPLPLARAYLQKDPGNTWQAESADWSLVPVNVHWIDWGDNLESVDWYTRSQVRTEVVLLQDLQTTMTEYEMRHTSGWGIDEVHGLATSLGREPLPGPGAQATVYSHCARLTIQKLLVERDDPKLGDLIWVPGEGWAEPEGYESDLINPHIFNGSVHEGGDGPGYYSAEINVKGRIIYGYTWSVRKLNEGAGDYRVTFSFDESCGSVDGVDIDLNTFFVDGVTEILMPSEEDLEVAAVEAAMSDPQVARTLITATDAEETEGGAVGVLDFNNNLTYMDVRILERGGGSGGGGGPGGGSRGGGSGHGRR